MNFIELCEDILNKTFFLTEVDANLVIPLAKKASKMRGLHTQAVEQSNAEGMQNYKQELLNLRQQLFDIISKDKRTNLTSTNTEPLTQQELDQRIDLARSNYRLDGIEHLHTRIIRKL